jgi:hypothetical protein
MAARLGISHDTLNRRLKLPEYAAAFEEGRQLGCANLSDAQLDLALAGNVVMCIWLGKQYLGQRDNIDSHVTGEGTAVNFTLSIREELLGRILGIAERRRLQEDTGGPDGGTT